MRTYKIIDCDGHVAEPFSLYTEYCEPEFRERAPKRIVKDDGSRAVIIDGEEFPAFVKFGGRALGKTESDDIVRPIQKPENFEGGVDGSIRLRDMDREGIDAAIIFPSGAASMCAIQNAELESAMYRAYNRWLAEYCSADTNRIKGNVLVSLRHPELAIEEINRVANEDWVGGISITPHIDKYNLDHPRFHPLWAVAQDYDLPICVHAGTGRPPYGLGTEEAQGCHMMRHLMTHPYEQQRAMATIMGGGVLDFFPQLRAAFIESGIGWVPWWLDRMDREIDLLSAHTPYMKRHPHQYMEDGQCFVSCLPEESSIEATIDQIGDAGIVFASDYPHWDCGFPETVQRLENRKISETAKKHIFETNALKLHTRFSSIVESVRNVS
ncbi:MAG: amidohydrolase [Halioglobus sp.]|nr:amidohydrolase [Halioglobus sp.]